MQNFKRLLQLELYNSDIISHTLKIVILNVTYKFKNVTDQKSVVCIYKCNNITHIYKLIEIY